MIAKVTCLLAAFAVVQGSILAGHGHLVNTGISSRAQSQDAWGNYAFGYDIKDGLGATNSRSEVGDGYGNKKGSYSLADIDGRARRVDYVADGHGFRAVVKTNEPGTAASAPAAAVIASPYAAPAAVKHAAIAAPLGYAGGLGHGGAWGYAGGLAHGAAAPWGYAGGLAHGAAAPWGYARGLAYGAAAPLAVKVAAPWGVGAWGVNGLGHGHW